MIFEFEPQEAYQCVEQELGNQLWRLEDSQTNDHLRRLLEGHLSICAACREEIRLGGGLSKRLQDGQVALEPQNTVGSRSRTRLLRTFGGGLLVAASLALVFILPPAPPEQQSRSYRSEDKEVLAFVSPVTGEKVGEALPRLVWTPLAGATSYKLKVYEIDGEDLWVGGTTDTRIDLPEDLAWKQDGLYRAQVVPVPADILMDGVVAVGFSTSSETARLLFRWNASPFWVWGLGLIGVLLMMWGMFAKGPFLPRR